MVFLGTVTEPGAPDEVGFADPLPEAAAGSGEELDTPVEQAVARSAVVALAVSAKPSLLRLNIRFLLEKEKLGDIKIKSPCARAVVPQCDSNGMARREIESLLDR
jgi:hypothetical protein